MASKSYKSVSGRDSKYKPDVVGRSAATGRFVLKPASKRGSISIKEANTAVRSVSSEKKKTNGVRRPA